MTDTDLLVLIPWAIAGAVLILICVRIHVSSGLAAAPQAARRRVQPPGMKRFC